MTARSCIYAAYPVCALSQRTRLIPIGTGNTAITSPMIPNRPAYPGVCREHYENGQAGPGLADYPRTSGTRFLDAGLKVVTSPSPCRRGNPSRSDPKQARPSPDGLPSSQNFAEIGEDAGIDLALEGYDVHDQVRGPHPLPPVELRVFGLNTDGVVGTVKAHGKPFLLLPAVFALPDLAQKLGRQVIGHPVRGFGHHLDQIGGDAGFLDQLAQRGLARGF